MKNELANLIAVLISPIAAVLISIWVQDRKELRARRFEIFRTLVATRHWIATEDQARAFNSIDAVFHDCPDVRRHWKEYFDLLNQPDRQPQWQVKYLELLKAMSNAIGLTNTIHHEDLDRIYGPKGLFAERERQSELSAELLRVLKASNAINMAVQAQDEKKSINLDIQKP